MRVLHLVTGSLYGGVERTLVALAGQRNAVPAFEQHFAYCFPGRFSQELKHIGAHSTELGPVRLRHLKSIRRVRRLCKQLLDQEHYDAVICHSPWTMVMFGSLVKSSKTRLVYWLHDIPLRQHKPLSILGILESLATKIRPALVICNSQFTCSYLSDLYPEMASSVIYCPLTLNELPPSVRGKTRLEHDVDPDTAVIIHVSRMQRWKGHLLLLTSLAQMKEQNGWEAWIVGGPQDAEEKVYFEELQTWADAAGISERVKFWGERADVDQLLAGSDIFCQANSRPEPFGIVFIEAMNASLPVVSTNWGGAREVITSECGLLAPPGDSHALSQLLQELVTSPALRKTLGSHGPQHAQELCNAGDRTRQLYDVINETCASGQQRPRAAIPIA